MEIKQTYVNLEWNANDCINLDCSTNKLKILTNGLLSVTEDKYLNIIPFLDLRPASSYFSRDCEHVTYPRQFQVQNENRENSKVLLRDNELKNKSCAKLSS